ncbi:MAG: Sua5/YciO/YrdC/YwlC family protein [Chromatiaceae bacterium]
MSRIAFIDLLFNWPPDGGARVDLKEVMSRLSARHSVTLLVPDFQDYFPRGRIVGTFPFEIVKLPFTKRTFNAVNLPRAFGKALKKIKPDRLFIADGWYLKFPLADALRDYHPILRFYAYEGLCIKDYGTQFRHGAICPRNYIKDTSECVYCALKNHRFRPLGIFSHEFLSALAFTPLYKRNVLRAVRAASTIIVYNDFMRRELAPLNPNVVAIPSGVDTGRFGARSHADNAEASILMTSRTGDECKGFKVLLEAVNGPVVATSGNISGEPVLTDNAEASRRLAGIADGLLQHDRPIVRPADDPVYRRIGGRMRPLRMGRGSAPCELGLPWELSRPVLAVGGHMKGTVALAWDRRVVVSPHIGEMDSPRSLDVFEQVAADLQSLYGVRAERLLCDAHPGYTTHRWATRQDMPVERIWHHEAHAGAVAAEYDRAGTWLVFTWDGVGLGPDGTMWGGEALVGRPGCWERFASLRTFRLPGGDQAGRQPWRSAVALHWECGLDWPGSPDDDGLARIAWRRLFDAAAAIVCDLPSASFEAQGPMLLEALCSKRAAGVALPLARDAEGVLRSDWQPLLGLLTDESVDRARRAEAFHASMAGVLLSQARAASECHDIAQIGLGGGVFQNRFLAELATALLEADGYEVCLPSALPCNDAALSFGQAAEYAARAATA